MPAPLSEARKRKGRPPLPKGRALSVLVWTRLTPEEGRELKARAASAGVSSSVWIRQALDLNARAR